MSAINKNFKKSSLNQKISSASSETKLSTMTGLTRTSVLSSTRQGIDNKDTLTFEGYYLPSYLNYVNPEEIQFDMISIYKNKVMTPQLEVITKLKTFTENKFDIVILGKDNEGNKFLGNSVFKCFEDPLGKDLKDHFGSEYAQARSDGLQIRGENENISKTMKDMLTIKEDKLRYSQVDCVVVYGLGLRIHIAAEIDKNLGIASSITEQQINTMASYLNFKKKYKSGWGINSFWITLDMAEKLSTKNKCMIELLVKIFGTRVFDSTIFMVDNKSREKEEGEKLAKDAQKEISQKVGCILEDITVLPVSLTRAKITNEEENFVTSTLKIFDAVAAKVYRDPNPFEPPGIDTHDAKRVIASVKEKFGLNKSDWCHVVNSVYTMIPN